METIFKTSMHCAIRHEHKSTPNANPEQTAIYESLPTSVTINPSSRNTPVRATPAVCRSDPVSHPSPPHLRLHQPHDQLLLLHVPRLHRQLHQHLVERPQGDARRRLGRHLAGAGDCYEIMMDDALRVGILVSSYLRSQAPSKVPLLKRIAVINRIASDLHFQKSSQCNLKKVFTFSQQTCLPAASSIS